MNRPPDMSATVEAAIAIVGAVRTKTLLMLVPSRMRDVRICRPRGCELVAIIPFGDRADS
jgi:hypothetical protein